MRADSVRALKAELTDPQGPDTWFLNTLRMERTTRTLSRRYAKAAEPPPKAQVALGIARRGSGYQLAARIQLESTSESNRLAAKIRTKARGEADIVVVSDVTGPRPIPTEPFAAAPSYFRQRHRPLEPGLSLGHVNITAGTLGAFVTDAHGIYILSNNHVLADVNKGRPGDAVAQPGPADKPPSTATLVGVLSRFVPISFAQINRVDCALARIDPDEEFWKGFNAALGTVPIAGPREIRLSDLGRTVLKCGRTTGITRGRITACEIDGLRVNMGGNSIAVFHDQIEVRGVDGAFSAGGDSGSLILDEAGHALALLFAGGTLPSGGDVTFANRITEVLRLIGAALVV